MAVLMRGWDCFIDLRDWRDDVPPNGENQCRRRPTVVEGVRIAKRVGGQLSTGRALGRKRQQNSLRAGAQARGRVCVAPRQSFEKPETRGSMKQFTERGVTALGNDLRPESLFVAARGLEMDDRPVNLLQSLAQGPDDSRPLQGGVYSAHVNAHGSGESRGPAQE